jgi:hypothetical protein
MITASQLTRLFRCPASNSFPCVRSTSEASERGVAIHAFLEDAIMRGRDAALASVAEEYRDVCEAIPIDRIPHVTPELAFAYDVETGVARVLGRGIGRKYGALGNSEIAGTADVVGGSDGMVYVGDYKTGRSYVEPAERNLQLAFLALAAARAYRVTSATVEILRVREHGELWIDRATLDVFDLDALATRLRYLVRHVHEADDRVSRGEVPNLSEGPWCDYCPSYLACPAKVGLVKRLALGTELDEIELMTRPLDPEVAGVAYERIVSAERMLARLKRSIYAVARERPIPLPSGNVLGEVTRQGNERLDGDIAWRVVERMHGREIADAAVTRGATKAGLRRALSGARGAFDAVLAEIRAEGGAEKPMRTGVEEYPGEKGAAE